MLRDPNAGCHTMSLFKTHVHPHKHTPLAHMPFCIFIQIRSTALPHPACLFLSLQPSLSTFTTLHPASALLLILVFFLFSHRWDGSSPGSGRLCQRQPATLPCLCKGWLCCERQVHIMGSHLKYIPVLYSNIISTMQQFRYSIQ